MTPQEQAKRMRDLVIEMNDLADQLEAQDTPAKKDNWPQQGDEYWALSDIGHYDANWIDNQSHKDRLKRGNVYRTKAEAKKADDRRILIAELWECEGAREFISEEYNFSLYRDHEDNRWDYSNDWTTQQAFEIPYFDTGEQAQAAIDKFGDRLDVLLGR